MSRNAPHTTTRAARDLEVPAATRTRSPGWRDPRLWVGVVLVTGSVVAGARILSSADDMTQVWSASADLAAGQTLTSADLEATRVRFDEAADHDRYLAVEDELPAALTLSRPLAAGELVPAAALGEEAIDDTVSVSIAVATEHVPPDLDRGSRVDVWVIDDPSAGGRRGGEAGLVLEDVAVLDAPLVSDSFASATTRQLVLAVPQADEEQLGRVLAAGAGDRVRVVGRG